MPQDSISSDGQHDAAMAPPQDLDASRENRLGRTERVAMTALQAS